MKVSSINSYITPKTTGYAAAGGFVLTALSGISKNKNFRKSHKVFAYITAAFTAFHVALIEYNRHKWEKEKNKQL